MQQIVANLPVKGADLVGPLPASCKTSSFMLPVSRPPLDTAAASRDLIRFLATPEVVRIVRAKGLEPG